MNMLILLAVGVVVGVILYKKVWPKIRDKVKKD